ncbi:Disease resistance protein (CC-NBS-LRR class) family [Euphorbia peplus]|nr:Disease resistance protein (CC-NBS-LRR class) family [Euphorbia peplus]
MSSTMADSEKSSEIIEVAKKIDKFLTNSIFLLSIHCMEGIDKFEDQCFSFKAMFGVILENTKLIVFEPSETTKKSLSELANQLELVYNALDQLFDTKEVCNSCFSSRGRLSFGQNKGGAIKFLSSVLKQMSQNEVLRELESCLATSIKRVVGNSPPESNFKNTNGGRERDRKIIIGLLLGDCSSTSNVSSDYVPVITIFGPGGLGKSKLARTIFDHSSIVNEFELRLWVNVGEEFDVKTVVENVVECIVGSRTEYLPLKTLKEFLNKLIFQKKFLLVLDDFSSDVQDDNEKWNELMECLEGGSDGSRMMVVTRRESVANRISSAPNRYELRGLSLNESSFLWDLDVSKGIEPARNKETRDKILRKCSQNPLEVELIGKVLQYRPSETELGPFMSEVLEKLDDPICQFVTRDEKIPPALLLSYSYLPIQLQKCFLYCGLFPKSKHIDVNKLIHHWIAQEYIIRPEGGDERLEEIGLEYFDYLVRRSFLKEGEKDLLGKVKSCWLDNLMHDLATSMATSLGHKMFKSLEVETFDGTQTRHVSFLCHFNTKSIAECSLDAHRLRTFLLPGQQILRTNEGKFRDSFSRDMLTKFKHLYVCDLHSSGLTKIPSCIGNLICLRYLDISENDEIKALPNAITKLRFLQVLNVSGCGMLEELPKMIRKLIDLRHLYCNRCWNLKYMPYGIGELTQLRTLSWFVIAEDSSLFTHIGGLEELGPLLNLREIEIRNLKYLKRGKSRCEKAKMEEKQHLQSLTLRWNHDEDDEDEENALAGFELVLHQNQNLKRLKVRDYKGEIIPFVFSFLINLVHISIKNCGRCKSLPPFDHIKTLEFLTVRNMPCLVFMDYNKDNINPSNGTLFKSLKKLLISNCPNLKGWLKSENETTALGIEQFPSLILSEIKESPKFKPEFPNSEEKPAPENASIETSVLKKKAHKGQGMLRKSAILKLIKSDHSPPLLERKVIKLPNKWKSSVTIRGVEIFPEELLKNLSSFQKLHIKDCPKMLSLPQALQHCTTLQELEISGCPELKTRCRNRKAADWPIIAHIPFIQISSRFIQRDGHFLPNLFKASEPGALRIRMFPPQDIRH